MAHTLSQPAIFGLEEWRFSVAAHSYCSYNKEVIVWDEKKRESNLRKHGLDFVDAHLVYDNPSKLTLASPRSDEDRRKDVALVQAIGRILALVYVEREGNVRIISFRSVSKRERQRFAQQQD